MKRSKDNIIIYLLFIFTPTWTQTANVKDVFNLQDSQRVPRDNKYYSSRYGSNPTSANNKAIKPEDSLEAHEGTQTPVEKRCTRCDYDYRYPYESRRFDDRDRRYNDKDRDYYDDRYRNYRYDDRDRDRYERDRYDYRRPEYDQNDRYRYDRYERGPSSDRYDRYYDRGVGYDNRGYDYRERYDREGYRPWDETNRGTSGWDSSGRGYYSAAGRPETGSGGYWGGGGTGGGYASGWNYSKDDRDRYYGGYNRPRDYYDGGGYRPTSYLYGRPSSTTTPRPSIISDDGNDNVTQKSQENNNSNN